MGASSVDAYDRHWRKVLQWLVDQHLPPTLSSLTVPRLLQIFDEQFNAGYCYSTPNLTRSAIALQCCLQLAPLPFVTHHPAVKAALKGFRRLAATRSVRRQPLGQGKYIALVQQLHEWVPLPLQCEVEALLGLGHVVLLRISEAQAILVRHITWEPRAFLLYLPESKTDQYKRGITLRIEHSHLRAQLQTLCTGRLPSDPLFHVSPHTMNDLIKRAADRLGWSGYYSYHSLRHGSATDLWLRTHDITAVMRAGRWATQAAARWYIHTLNMPLVDDAVDTVAC